MRSQALTCRRVSSLMKSEAASLSKVPGPHVPIYSLRSQSARTLRRLTCITGYGLFFANSVRTPWYSASGELHAAQRQFAATQVPSEWHPAVARAAAGVSTLLQQFGFG